MDTIVYLQVVIGCIAALMAIVAAFIMAAFLVGANFEPNWPPDWFGNLLGAAALIAIGFGVAEGFLALTRYAAG